MSASGEIIVKNLGKKYQVAQRSSDLKSTLKAFFNRKYTEIEALKDVSFTIKKGELVGYIGPNGAGKSTTVKIMSGILTPSSGNCTVNGMNPSRDRIAHVKEIGVVFGQRSQLWWDVPVIDSFEMIRDIYRIDALVYKEMKETLVEQLDLADIINTPVRQLSLGQRMRCELAASLLHRPAVLFLDEPTIGLDAISKLAVRNFIKEINERYQTTVILTTHDMDDIEALCNRVIVIGRGKLLFDGVLSDLRKLVKEERRLVVDYAKHYKAPQLPHAHLQNQSGTQVTYAFDPSNIKASELIKIASTDYEVEDVLVHSASIEEIIAELYGVLQI